MSYSIVKQAFIKLIQEYNSNPIPEINEHLFKIHKEYKNSSIIDHVFITCIHDHVDITKATETDEFRQKYPNFLQKWGEYMKLQLEYQEYQRTL